MEAVLDFGRGCQNLAIILGGVWGEGAEMERRPALRYHIYRGGGVRGGGQGGERERTNLS